MDVAVGAARLGADLALELLGLDLAVALEGDAVDDLVLGNGDDHAAAAAAHAHVGEQAGGVEVLHALVHGVVVGSREVRADRLAVDAAVPADADLGESGRKKRQEGQQEGRSESEPVEVTLETKHYWLRPPHRISLGHTTEA